MLEKLGYWLPAMCTVFRETGGMNFAVTCQISTRKELMSEKPCCTRVRNIDGGKKIVRQAG